MTRAETPLRLVLLILLLLSPVRMARAWQDTPESGPIVIRSLGHQYGFEEPDGSGRLVWVFLDGVEVTQGERRMVGEVLVVVLRSGDDAGPAPPLPEGGLLVPGERVDELYLDGQVGLEEADETILGASSLHIDNRTGRISVLEGRWRGEVANGPLAVRFGLMRQLAGGVRELEDLSYTTCEFEHAHWAIETPWARLVPTPHGRVLHTAGNTIRVGDLPVLWLPGLHLNVDKDRPPLRRLGVGNSRRFGTKFETLWGGDATDLTSAVGGWLGADRAQVDGEWELRLDNYSSRGVFVEPTFRWSAGKSFGTLFGSYIHDHNKRDELGEIIQDSTRGRIDLESRTELGEGRVVDAELSYLSDPGYLEEYYENEARNGKVQETYVNYRDYDDNQVFSVLARARVNDFDTQVEYLPGFQRRVAGQVVDLGALGTPVVSARVFGDYVRLAAADTQTSVDTKGDNKADELFTPTQAPSYHNARVGTAGELVWPFDLEGNQLQIIAGWDVTGFKETGREVVLQDDPAVFDDEIVESTESDDGSALRWALTGGAQWSTTFSGTNSDYSSDTWNMRGLRHVIEPRVGYRSVLELSHDPDELLPVDSVEQLSKSQAFVVGVRHRIQTHQRDRVATILDTDVSVPLFPNEDRDNADLGEYDPAQRNDPETVGEIRVDTRWRPGADIPGLRDAEVRWRGRIDPNYNTRTKSFLSYTTRIDEDTTFRIADDKATLIEAGKEVDDFHVLTVGAEWTVSQRWSAAVFVQEDQLLDEGMRRGLILRQRAHRWFIDIEASWRRGEDRVSGRQSNDTRISLSLSPTFLGGDESLLDSLGRIPAR